MLKNPISRQSSTRMSVTIDPNHPLSNSQDQINLIIKQQWKEAKKSFTDLDSFRKSHLNKTLNPHLQAVKYTNFHQCQMQQVAQQFQDFSKIMNEIDQSNTGTNSARFPHSRQKKRSFFIYDQTTEPEGSFSYSRPISMQKRRANSKSFTALQSNEQSATKKKPLHLSKLITTCSLNRPRQSNNFYYEFKKVNQSSEKNLNHLQMDKLDLILDKETQNFTNKKKLLSNQNEKQIERLNKELAKEYLNFQRSIDKINFDLANCVFQQSFNEQNSKLQFNRKQKQRFLEYLKKVQQQKEIEEITEQKLERKQSFKDTTTDSSPKKETEQKKVQEKLGKDSYRDLEIRFDPITMSRLHALYQQQQVKQLESKGRARSQLYKKETSQEKASRLIQLNVLIDKQHQNIRQILIDKSKKKDFMSKTIGGSPNKIDHQLSSTLKTQGGVQGSPSTISKATTDQDRTQVSAFETSLPILNKNISKSQIDEIIEKSQSSIEEDEFQQSEEAEEYVMQSKFSKSQNKSSRKQSEFAKNHSNPFGIEKGAQNWYKYQRNKINERNQKAGVQKKSFQEPIEDEGLKHLKKLVNTMNGLPQTKNLIKSISQHN